ncbi:ABC transporter permease [Streptomyces sp. Ru72]|uniref:ABC transporter permease n=1 Tax=Streptomyces sp. Ru72 TaxID=2080747 RepID=UPI000CDDDE60|nr:ABC transporter permease [Streptomyces sp. Ru72]POX39795.1 ABC transporter permease [Streptomyces sp. Ru72]
MTQVTQATQVEKSTAGLEPAGQGAGFAGLAWLTWRQHRWTLLGSLVLAAALTGWMAYLASDMTSLYHQCHNTLCPVGSPQFQTLNTRFTGPIDVADNLLLGVRYLPLLIGIFLGVPLLAREYEQRTLLLAWSQDISPVRWLWTKLALIGLFVAALTAALSAVADHLAHVLHNVGGGSMFDGSLFLDSGMLPLAFGVSWFAIGVALGAAVRRILPAAMAVILGFVGLMLTVQWHFPTLEAPVSRFFPFGDPANRPGFTNALVINGGIQVGPDHVVNLFDASRHALNWAQVQHACPNFLSLPGEAVTSCFARNHFQRYAVYQPGSRIPEFHLIIASGYLGLGLLALVAAWLLVCRAGLSAG